MSIMLLMPSLTQGLALFIGWLLVLGGALPGMASAEAIAVPSSQKGLFGPAAPTMTFFFEAKDTKVTLVFIPGGGGNIGIQPDWTAEHRYFSGPFNRMLRRLANPKATSGQSNLVIFDNPSDMPYRRGWSVGRTSADHLSRVEDVVRFYVAKAGKPVWVMGHSAGSISVSELYKRLQEGGQEQLVAGLVYSAGVAGTSFAYETTRVPILVLHHENDECVSTPSAQAAQVHAQLRGGGNTAAELVLIKSGTRAPDGRNPCESGFHMYLGANVEAAEAIDLFIAKHGRPR